MFLKMLFKGEFSGFLKTSSTIHSFFLAQCSVLSYVPMLPASTATTLSSQQMSLVDDFLPEEVA